LRESAEPATVPADQGPQPTAGPTPSFEGSARPDPSRLPTNKLNAAIIAAAIGVALTFIGFVLYAYYYERMIDPNRDFNRIMDLFDIAKYSMYAKFAGEVAALAGAVLVIQAVMVGGLGSASAAARQIRLGSILWIGIVMTALMAVVTVAMVYIYEAEPDLSESAMRMVSRMVVYLPQAAVVLGAVALLVVTVFLRSASLGRGATTVAEPPGTQ
jgi:hypothetical protein